MKINVKMKKAKETKNTEVYKNDEDGAAIPSLYIRKDAFEGKTAPDEITVEIKG